LKAEATVENAAPKARPISEQNYLRYTQRCTSEIKLSSPISSAYQLIDNKSKSGLLLLDNLFRSDQQQQQSPKKVITAEMKEMILRRNDELLGLTPAFKNLTVSETKKNCESKNESTNIKLESYDQVVEKEKAINRSYYASNILAQCNRIFSNKFPLYDPLKKEVELPRSNTISFQLQTNQNTFANGTLTKYYPNTRIFEATAKSNDKNSVVEFAPSTPT
jgi:hypothetical protein